ncbi:MAG TPA: hypothetical protein VFX96_12875 [Pyrinomonadaceae bacterium]|nr:hypothetical protein [Pyrinomonadaceae bacterium]
MGLSGVVIVFVAIVVSFVVVGLVAVAEFHVVVEVVAARVRRY